MKLSDDSAPTWADNVKRRTAQLAVWTGAWLVTLALATFGSSLWWPGRTAVSLAAIALNVAVGVGMVLAIRRHLNSLDELQQRIQLEAMAVTLGVGLVLGLALATLDVAHLVDAEISHLVMLMGATYGVGVVVGTKRYT